MCVCVCVCCEVFALHVLWKMILLILNFLFLQSTRDESSLDRHTYSVLEAGLYVPTEVCGNTTSVVKQKCNSIA